MIRLLLNVVAVALRATFRSREDLVLENIALRQQLAVLKSKKPRPKIADEDRRFWVSLRRIWSKWANALIIVQPDTVVRWHRQGFRWYWGWKSRVRRPGRPRGSKEIRDLIRQMANENVTWGAPRIHGEILKLGFDVSERTVSRYMPRRPTPPDAVKRWLAFLRNHRDAIAGMEFFTLPTARFEILYRFFVISHARRRILQFDVTYEPGAVWIIQQLREAFPFETVLRYVILDRDGKYGQVVPTALKNMGVKPVRISRRSPWQNGTAERWVLSARTELLDHVVVLGRRHLRRLLRSYVAYYHEDRCHLSLGKDPPIPRTVTPRPSPEARVVSLPRDGGVHHRYEWRDAA